MDKTVLSAGRQLLEPAVELRRRIHAHPELGLELPRTQHAVLEALDGLGLAVSSGSATTSVVAVLEGGRPGPTTLLRADMDGLPMPEDTGLPFGSKVEGAMHACGHDAHVAMLAGAARLLAGRRDEVPGRVVFMFQPGEEGHGGARVMLAEGLLERHGPIEGTVRAISDATRTLALERLHEVTEHIAAAHLCTAQVTALPGCYPVTVNDAVAARRTLEVAAALLGDDHAVEMASPIMGAEDWSYILQRVPGSMAFLGAAPTGVDNPAPNHSNRMVLDEQAIGVGIAMHAAMVLA